MRAHFAFTLLTSWALCRNNHVAAHRLGQLEANLNMEDTQPATRIAAATSSNTAAAQVTYDVVIIGAGWAGLGAAKTLLSKSITNFNVLEARNYVGGRSKTSYEWGEDVPVDLGSAWVQGKTNNPVQALIDAFGVKYGVDPETEAVYDTSGRRYNDDEIKYIYETYGIDDTIDDQEADDTFFGYRQKTINAMPATTDVALGTAATEYMNKKDMSIPQKEDFEFLLTYIPESNHAADASDMSLRWFDNDCSLPGGDSYLGVPKGGYSAVVNKYAESVLPKIQLGAVATKVDYSVTPVQVRYVSDGVESTIFTEKVIITLPLGVLKAGDVEFIPAFSNAGITGEKKQSAIDQLGMGVQNKIVLYWENMQSSDVFWPKDRQWIDRITDLKSQGNMTMWYNAYNFNGHTPILVGWIQGDLAEKMENSTDAQITEEAVAVLRDLFGDIPEPTHSMITRWKSEKYSQGSYSFQKIGSNELSRADLTAPLYDKVFFAGEATHELYSGTTHGALMSGFDAALSVLPLLSAENNNSTNTTTITAALSAFMATSSSPRVFLSVPILAVHLLLLFSLL